MSRPLPKHLASREFVLSVIEDMRTALATPGYALNMTWWASTNEEDGCCHVCAGGAAVIFGMGGRPDYYQWTPEQDLVADWCDSVRTGDWDGCACNGHPVPESACDAWDCAMIAPRQPDFFSAWERFANALPTLAEIEGVKP